MYFLIRNCDKGGWLWLLFFMFVNTVAAQTDTVNSKLFKNWKPDVPAIKESFKKIQINGYYRFLGYHRKWNEKLFIANDPSSDAAVQIGGDGYREPTLFLNLGGEVHSDVFIGTNFYIAPNYNGPVNTPIDGDSISLNLGATLYGNFKLKTGGNVLVQTGGIVWFSGSKLTFWNNATPYNRFSIFDRNPWEPVMKGAGKYRTFINEGKIVQDVRWNKQAFQGALVEAFQLPGKISGAVFVGKSINNGGAASYRSIYSPSLLYGTRVSKSIGFQQIALNLYRSTEMLDSLKSLTKENTVMSGELELNMVGLEWQNEIGIARFVSPELEGNYDHAILSKLKFPKEVSGIPIELSYYHIGKNFVNVNSAVINTSVPQAYSNKAANGLVTLYPFYSQVTEIGAYTNNRQSFTINAEWKRKNFNFNVGNMMSKELSKSGPKISFYHRINGLALSRIFNFSWMPSNYGPYSNLNSVFRGIYEVVSLTDTTAEGSSSSIKFFNTLEWQAKYRIALGKQHVYAHYVGSYNSVQKKSSFIPVFDENAYLRIQYHEWEIFYQVLNSVTLTGYYGKEFVKGNSETAPGDSKNEDGTNRFLNQEGTGIGVGFDLSLGQNVGLYGRHRWFKHHDPSFRLDTYKGQESTLELKMFF